MLPMNDSWSTSIERDEEVKQILADSIVALSVFVHLIVFRGQPLFELSVVYRPWWISHYLLLLVVVDTLAEMEPSLDPLCVDVVVPFVSGPECVLMCGHHVRLNLLPFF